MDKLDRVTRSRAETHGIVKEHGRIAPLCGWQATHSGHCYPETLPERTLGWSRTEEFSTNLWTTPRFRVVPGQPETTLRGDASQRYWVAVTMPARINPRPPMRYHPLPPSAEPGNSPM